MGIGSSKEWGSVPVRNGDRFQQGMGIGSSKEWGSVPANGRWAQIEREYSIFSFLFFVFLYRYIFSKAPLVMSR
jgi:hypothetical protein